jgi:hypothetical protein
MFQPHSASTDPVTVARQALDALSNAFNDDGVYSREMTTEVLNALGTCVSYLRVCLGPAQPVAIPDATTLANVLLSLHIACAQLHAALQPALRAIGRRQWQTDPTQMHITQIVATRAALSRACDALLTAAHRFAEAHAAAAGTAP